MIKIQNNFTKSCSPNFIFLTESHFQKNLGGLWVCKYILKTENTQFLLALHQVSVNVSMIYVKKGFLQTALIINSGQ